MQDAASWTPPTAAKTVDFPGESGHTAEVPRNPRRRPLTLASTVVLAVLALVSELRAEGALRFEDLSSLLSGPRSPDPKAQPRHDYGPLWGDFDGDGWIDLIFMNHGDFPSLYRNRGGLELVDRFDESGLQKAEWAYPQQKDRHGAACADFDNDGDLDIFITHGAKRGETLGIKSDELLANNGDGTFVDVSEQAGTRNTMGRARTPVWLDYDGDGWLDLLVGNYISANLLLRNGGGKPFVDTTASLDLGQEGSAHPSWADVDLDRDPDLLSVGPVDLRRNQEGGAFQMAQIPGLEAEVPLALAVTWGHFDADALIDAFITSGTASGAASRLFDNESGNLRSRPLDLGLHPKEGAAGAAAGDLDNDGDVDLAVLGRRQVRLLVNEGDGAFSSQRLEAPGLAPGYEGDIALADLNQDGFLDLAISASDGQHLFGNRQTGEGWLKLLLRGHRSNADGLGALVSVAAAGEPTLHRQHLGDSGFYKSVSCAPLHLGTGKRAALDVTIAWPSGVTQRLRALPASRTVIVAESSQ